MVKAAKVLLVWLGAGLVLVWALYMPRVTFVVPVLSRVFGVEFSIVALCYPVLFVPLVCTWLALPSGAGSSVVIDNTGGDE